MTGVSVQPCWTVDEWGRQKLHWQHPVGSLVFFHHRLYLMWEDTGVVATAQCPLSAAAISQAINEKFCLDYQQVGDFLEHRGSHWRTLGLPLPVESVVVEDEVQVQPVLHLTSSPLGSATGPADRLELMFLYSSAEFCAVFHASVRDEGIHYWDGEHIRRLCRQPSVEQDWYRLLQT